jgi:xanthine dehydrogenase accessory factor
MACASEGALEVYLEPMLPHPRVVVIGRSPAVDTLASLATTLGWRTTIVDDGGIGVDHPEGVPVLTSLDLSPLRIDERTCVVVATQGHYDEQALQAALATSAGYVGLVASRRRAEGVLDFLRDRGVAADALARVRAPAGLDLGPVDHEEIAVAVLAELVSLRAAGALAAGARAVTLPEEAIDPVCGMTVDVASAHYRAEYEGRTYYFCAGGCQRSFEADPAKFAAAAT